MSQYRLDHYHVPSLKEKDRAIEAGQYCISRAGIGLVRVPEFLRDCDGSHPTSFPISHSGATN